jgi:PhoPQ-activated pathogenicity-related protein
VPDEVKHADKALLVISGGSTSKKTPKPTSMEVLLTRDIAVKTKSVIAIVGQVPNQPLFEGKSEDALIAHTFQKYLDTGDESWPALLPMAKAARRAMDCVQEFLKGKREQAVDRWVVTGASKRGWTTWLAAAFDKRVIGIAPMVIDTLNFPKQMALQRESFGDFSDEIGDYTELDLPSKMASKEGARLVEMVDPYSYRDRFKMPKLIVLGTNDRYWPVDAVGQYFRDLPGETLIHYVPNAGHGLGDGALQVTSAFYETILNGTPRPKIEWICARDGRDCRFTVKSPDEPLRVELWSATSADRDFRNDRWSGTETECRDGCWTACVSVPEEGFVASHVRLVFKDAHGTEYSLCTNVEVTGAAKK